MGHFGGPCYPETGYKSWGTKNGGSYPVEISDADGDQKWAHFCDAILTDQNTGILVYKVYTRIRIRYLLVHVIPKYTWHSTNPLICINERHQPQIDTNQ